eukprot:TRINITY_DN7211_c0_g1_i1.p1 TRINITY_DN7211_c0_g1~~TRINITY_DN7211_c0_g1_i1.p1  ORF type:complete len:527 (-),score=138.38 TRINITY_DN7211_c0_g1_i1:32-1612(-)
MSAYCVSWTILLSLCIVLGQQHHIDPTTKSNNQLVGEITDAIQLMKEGSSFSLQFLEPLIDTHEFLDNVNYEDELQLLKKISKTSKDLEYIQFRLGVSLARNERYEEAIRIAEDLINTSSNTTIHQLSRALMTHSFFLSGDFSRGSSLLPALDRSVPYVRTIASQFDQRVDQIEKSKLQPQPTEPISEDYQHYFSVCAIFRDEGAYLQEWIAFHLLVGVDHFYLWEHQSSPTDPWESILAPYIAEGKVTLHRAGKEAMQGKIMDECIRTYAKDNFWISVIDIDEFLVPLQKDSVPEVLRSYEDEYGVFVSWRLFAGYPHVTQPDQLVTSAYVHPIAREHSQEGKLIINTRVAPVDICKFSAREDRNSTDPGLNHNCFSWNSSWVYVVDEMRRGIKEDWKLSPPSYHHLQLNHYHSRSMQECMAKAKRGFSWLEQILPPNIEDWPPSIRDRKTGKRCFQSEQYCLRSQKDEAILRFLPDLKLKMSEAKPFLEFREESVPAAVSSECENDTEAIDTTPKVLLSLDNTV